MGVGRCSKFLGREISLLNYLPVTSPRPREGTFPWVIGVPGNTDESKIYFTHSVYFLTECFSLFPDSRLDKADDSFLSAGFTACILRYKHRQVALLLWFHYEHSTSM